MACSRRGNESAMTKAKTKATPRKIGRPTKFTPKVRELILSAVREGNYIETAAQSAGINKDTFYSWMVKGETSCAPKEFSDFSEAIKRARAEAEIQALAVIQVAANRGIWQAAAWYLERSYPDRFGRTRLETPGVAEQPIPGNAAVVDLLDERIALMRERSRAIIESLYVPAATVPGSAIEAIVELVPVSPTPIPVVVEAIVEPAAVKPPIGSPVNPRRRVMLIRPGQSLRDRR